jgi:predicted ester cyclase
MKKIFVMMAASLLMLTACNSDKTESTGEKMEEGKMSDDKMSSSAEDKEERNKKIVMASLEGIKAQDVNIVLKDAAADITDFADGSMPVTKGLDSVRAGITSWFAAFPDVKIEDFKIVADGDWVMVWGNWSGTWKGDFMGQKATGKSYKAKDVDIFKLNDEGKITEHHFVQSPMTVGMQIGMKPPK